MTTVILAVLAFMATIGILVSIHEYGHLLVARWMGIGVIRYSVGFGPKLWRVTSRRSGIEYCVSAIPLGGYVKMIDERDGEVSEADKPLAFNRARPIRRIAVLAAGPSVNLVFALAAYWLVFMLGTSGVKPIIGQPGAGTLAAQAALRRGDTITAVDGRAIHNRGQLRIALLQESESGDDADLTVERSGITLHRTLKTSTAPSNPKALDRALGITTFEPDSTPRLYRVVPGSPAANSGLAKGAEITRLNGTLMKRPQELIAALREKPGQTVRLTVKRGDEARIVPVTLGTKTGADGRTIGHIGAAIGGSPEAAKMMQVTRHYGPLQALGAAWRKTGEVTRLTISFVSGMIAGHVSLSNLGGPVTIATTGGAMAALGLQAFIGFLALVSLSLAILNMIPLPVLDGGQMVLAGVEWIARRPLPVRVQNAIQGVGAAGLYLIMGIAFFNDVVRLGGG